MRCLKDSPGRPVGTNVGVKPLEALVTTDLIDENYLKISPTGLGRDGSIFTDILCPKNLSPRRVKSHPSGLIGARYAKKY